MKIDLFINLLDGKKRLGSSAKIRLKSDAAYHESFASRESDPEAYRLHLSSQSLSSNGQLASQIREQNEKALRTLGLINQEQPKSLSMNLEKPEINLEGILSQIQQNPQSFLDAHSEVNREKTVSLLS